MEGIEKIAINEWSQGLAGVTGDEIKKGLDSLSGEWPPSLPEFLKACKGKSDGFGLGYTPECYRVKDEPKLLTKKLSHEELSKKIAELRSAQSKT